MSFDYAGVSFPLPSATTTALLEQADPAVYLALDYCAFAIRTYIGERLVAEAARADCKADISDAVKSKFPYAPGKYLMQEHMPLPALFLFRHTSKNDYKTLSRSHSDSTLELNWVLPALSAAQAERIMPVQHAVEFVLAHMIERGQDDAYTPPGGSLGEPVWLRAGIERIDITDFTYGAFAGVGDLYLPALTMTLLVKERHKGEAGSPIATVHAQVPIRAPDGTTTEPIVESDLSPP